jgi:uncharacterized Zn ribbon protein
VKVKKTKTKYNEIVTGVILNWDSVVLIKDLKVKDQVW